MFGWCAPRGDSAHAPHSPPTPHLGRPPLLAPRPCRPTLASFPSLTSAQLPPTLSPAHCRTATDYINVLPEDVRHSLYRHWWVAHGRGGAARCGHVRVPPTRRHALLATRCIVGVGTGVDLRPGRHRPWVPVPHCRAVSLGVPLPNQRSQHALPYPAHSEQISRNERLVLEGQERLKYVQVGGGAGGSRACGAGPLNAGMQPRAARHRWPPADCLCRHSL